MTRSSDKLDIGNRRQGLTMLLATAVAIALTQDACGHDQIRIAQAEEPAVPEETGVFNWLGNLIGHGLSAKPRPAPVVQPADAGDKAAKESGTARSGNMPDAPVQPTPAMPPAGDTTTTVGLLLELGKSPPMNAAPSSCITKARETVRFCVEPVEWPEELRAHVWVNSHMYQGTYGVVRYDNGRASYIHALIPTTSYDAVVAWYVSRWGAPDQTNTRQAVRFNEPKVDNPTAIWQRSSSDGTLGPALEIRRIDDTRGGFADSRNGVVMLYAPTAKPIFPQLSSVELMALRIVEDAVDRPEGATTTAPLQPAVAAPRQQPGDGPNGVSPPQAAASPTAAAAHVTPNELPMAPSADANPFIPLNPVSPKLAIGGVESPALTPEIKPTPSIPPDSGADPSAAATEASDGVFGRLARLFDSTPPTGGPSQGQNPSPSPTPLPARVDRTPDMRPPVYGFFTRLIRTYTDDGSEIARIGATPPTLGQMLRDVPLAIDERLGLGMNRPVDGHSAVCIDNSGTAGSFCLMTPTWPPGPSAALVRTVALPTIGLAALRFDFGRVSHIQLRFNGDGYDRVVAFFAERYGPPTERAVQRSTTAGENPVALWRSVNSSSGAVSTLEIRRYDDLLSDTVDSRIGVIRVYQDNAAPQFPPLTSFDLSALQ